MQDIRENTYLRRERYAADIGGARMRRTHDSLLSMPNTGYGKGHRSGSAREWEQDDFCNAK